MNQADRWALLYAALIIALSSIPGHSMPRVELLSQDKLIHLAEYAIFSILVARAVQGRTAVPGRIFLATFIACTLFGLMDEGYQALIPGRDASLLDWLADTLGVLIGSGAYLKWTFRHA